MKELEAIARDRTRSALAGWSVPAEYLADLTLGVFLDEVPGCVVFALYVAGETPLDAIRLTTAKLDRETGAGPVEVHFEHLEKAN